MRVYGSEGPAPAMPSSEARQGPAPTLGYLFFFGGGDSGRGDLSWHTAMALWRCRRWPPASVPCPRMLGIEVYGCHCHEGDCHGDSGRGSRRSSEAPLPSQVEGSCSSLISFCRGGLGAHLSPGSTELLESRQRSTIARRAQHYQSHKRKLCAVHLKRGIPSHTKAAHLQPARQNQSRKKNKHSESAGRGA